MLTAVVRTAATRLMASQREAKPPVAMYWYTLPDVSSRAALAASYWEAAISTHRSPPDAQPTATELVLRQMETSAEEWSPRAS